jgi:hypothetical protein
VEKSFILLRQNAVLLISEDTNSNKEVLNLYKNSVGNWKPEIRLSADKFLILFFRGVPPKEQRVL